MEKKVARHLPVMKSEEAGQSLLAQLNSNFRTVFFEVCRQGYVCLGRTRPGLNHSNEWQHQPGFPPSYSAMGRYRFLKTLEIARARGAQRILEVACGGGFNAACLYEQNRKVVINDLRLMNDELVYWTTGAQLDFVQGDIFTLSPQALGTFDLVMACEVIEHVAHGDRFLRHLRQFVAPGGALLITTPNGKYFRSKLPTYSQITDFGKLESFQFQPDAQGHLYLYSREELEKILSENNLEQIQTEFFITPWLSGHWGFRFLPGGNRWLGIYFFLDGFFRRFGLLCTQMVTVATAPADR